MIFKTIDEITRDEWIAGAFEGYKIVGYYMNDIAYADTRRVITEHAEDRAADYDAYRAAREHEGSVLVAPAFGFPARDMTEDKWILHEWEVDTASAVYRYRAPASVNGAATRQRSFQTWINSGDRARGLLLDGLEPGYAVAA